MSERKRDYEKELKWQASPEQKKNRAARNAARAKMIREGKVKKGDGKDVHHKDSDPRNNDRSNLQVKSRSANRATKGREW